jgi:FO synthase
MLESTSVRLMEAGGAHFNCPDKEPSSRLRTIEDAGKLRVPFTSGLLIGIGESRRERMEALMALKRLHMEHGHIQEIIIQNFVPKPGTAMAGRYTEMKGPSRRSSFRTLFLSLGPQWLVGTTK